MIAPWIIYAIINAFVTSIGITISYHLMITICYGLVLTGIIALLYLLYNANDAKKIQHKNSNIIVYNNVYH
jgi:hypothetical protein